jgi:uncharacterized membrane-anchored protein
MPLNTIPSRPRVPAPRRTGALRVPEIVVAFWIVKALSTAMGESTSDFLVTAIDPPIAVALGFVAFVVALAVQLRAGRYVAWTYWATVVMVGIFGTMAADVVHATLGLSFTECTILYALVLAAVFAAWYRVEGTLSIHEVDTVRRELFYWAAVSATFAMGTALGDLTAVTLHLGFGLSVLLFAVLIAIPAAGYRWFGWNPILCFWTAYVLTRPLGASVADGLAKSRHGGLGLGDGPVTVALGVLIVGTVWYLAVSKVDVQAREAV